MSGARYVFISYSRDDVSYVERLTEHLRSAGLEVWTDHGIDHGSRWPLVIEERIHACTAMVVVMSPASRTAAWVDREVDLAQELGKPILPLRLAGQTFLRLRDVHHEDVTGAVMPKPAFIATLRSLLEPAAGSSGNASPRRSDAGAHQQAQVTTQPPASSTPRPVRPRSEPIVLSGHNNRAIVGVTWAPDSRHVASASADGKVLLWEPQTRRRLAAALWSRSLLPVRSRQGPVPLQSVAWSSAGRLAALSDKRVLVWDQPVSMEQQHQIEVLSAKAAAWSPDGAFLAVSAYAGVDLLTATGEPVRQVRISNLGRSLAWSSTGDRVALSAGREIAVWGVGGTYELARLSGHDRLVTALARVPEGVRLATASDDGTVKLWDTVTMKLVDTLIQGSSPLGGVAWSPDGLTMATRSDVGEVRIWDPVTRACLATFAGTTVASSSAAFAYAPNGRWLASGDDSGTVRIWDLGE